MGLHQASRNRPFHDSLPRNMKRVCLPRNMCGRIVSETYFHGDVPFGGSKAAWKGPSRPFSSLDTTHVYWQEQAYQVGLSKPHTQAVSALLCLLKEFPLIPEPRAEDKIIVPQNGRHFEIRIPLCLGTVNVLLSNLLSLFSPGNNRIL